MRHLVVDVASHQVELIGDVVVDANRIFPDVGRLLGRGNELWGVAGWVDVWFRDGACAHEEHGIRIQRGSRDDVCISLPAQRSATAHDREWRTCGRVEHSGTFRSAIPLGIGKISPGSGKVLSRDCVLGSSVRTLDVLAPLFRPEEEGLIPGAVVKMRNDDRAADIAAVNIQPQLGAGSVCLLVEVVAGIQIVVADKLPQAAVEGSWCRF